MNPAWMLAIPKAKRTTKEDVEAYENKRLVISVAYLLHDLKMNLFLEFNSNECCSYHHFLDIGT